MTIQSVFYVETSCCFIIYQYKFFKFYCFNEPLAYKMCVENEPINKTIYVSTNSN